MDNVPKTPTQNAATAVSGSTEFEQNSTQAIVLSGPNEHSIHQETIVITELATTVVQPQTKPSNLMKHFFQDFKYFEEVNVKGVAKSKWSGNCKLCMENNDKHVTYKDVLGTSSNF